MKTFLHAGCALLVAAVCLGWSEASAQETKLSPTELAARLFAPQRLPQIQLRGRFEFFSADEKPALELASSADFTGETDLASRRTRFEFQHYRSPVYQSKPALHAFYSVAFDGSKWVVVDDQVRINAQTWKQPVTAEITAEHPGMFLKSLDHLCFPLFASLLNVQVGFTQKAVPLREVLAGNADGAAVDTVVDGSFVVLTVRKDGVTDEMTFDAAKGYALTSHRTNFGPKNKPTDNSILNDLTITEFTRADDLWFPKAGTFTQTFNGKVWVKRDYRLDAMSVSPDPKPIEAVIPPDTFVRDERTGENYRTAPAAR